MQLKTEVNQGRPIYCLGGGQDSRDTETGGEHKEDIMEAVIMDWSQGPRWTIAACEVCVHAFWNFTAEVDGGLFLHLHYPVKQTEEKQDNDKGAELHG